MSCTSSPLAAVYTLTPLQVHGCDVTRWMIEWNMSDTSKAGQVRYYFSNRSEFWFSPGGWWNPSNSPITERLYWAFTETPGGSICSYVWAFAQCLGLKMNIFFDVFGYLMQHINNKCVKTSVGSGVSSGRVLQDIKRSGFRCVASFERDLKCSCIKWASYLASCIFESVNIRHQCFPQTLMCGVWLRRFIWTQAAVEKTPYRK